MNIIPIETKTKEQIDIFNAIRRRNKDDRYEWRQHAGFSFPGDAHEIGKRIEAMADENGGMIGTDQIVIEGDMPGSPLYPCFEHDMEIAAMNWQRHTARNLVNSIRLVKVVIEYQDEEERRTTIDVPAFPNVTVNGERKYVPVYTVAKEPILKNQVVDRLLREAKLFAQRAKEFNIFSRVVEEIGALPDNAPEGKPQIVYDEEDEIADLE